MHTIKQSLNPAFLKLKPHREEIDFFKKELGALLDRINPKESEEYHKNLIKDFLNAVYYKDKHYINTHGRVDLVIHNESSTASAVGVLIETKSPVNKTEMVSRGELHSPNLNVKSFQELVLYYLRERKTGKNFELRHLIITNIYEWFVFDAQDFEKLFYQNKILLKRFEQFQEGTLSGTNVDFFYKEIAAPEILKIQNEIPFTHFDIRDYHEIVRRPDNENDRLLIALYKFLSPVNLLKRSFANDNNQLNKEFYAELLHIIGLEEVTQGNRKIIVRKNENDRDSGSLIENTIERIDAKNKWDNLTVETGHAPSLQFDVALDLAITWINRVLFLKLLESQILKYHNGNREYAFLSPDKLSGYNDLDTLFFSVLARKEEERTKSIQSKFANVPYLNSALFEITEMENKTICIDSLRDTVPMPLYPKSVLLHSRDVARHVSGIAPSPSRDVARHVSTMMPPLEYLLRFLDAFDFSSEGAEDIQETYKPLISASVLGLIFEKINGYRDGSFFTPSFITMYMCRETIRQAVIQKFNDVWSAGAANYRPVQTVTDLYNRIDDLAAANDIFNSLRICDPAVGSGHFLVSALNEMIYLKSELGLLTDKNGKRLKDYRASVENDELIITDTEGNYVVYNPKDRESQRVQETFFREKQTIIENCLFGADINPNSVKICQLRLWIELLKHAYYTVETGRAPSLQTLPNIDINIKCGNSLISRFDIQGNYVKMQPAIQQKLRLATRQYKELVVLYKATSDKATRRYVRDKITQIKYIFSDIHNPVDADYRKLLKTEAKLNEHFSSMQIGIDREVWKKTLEKLQVEVDTLRKKYETKIKTAYSNAFEWGFEFPEVLDDDGNFVGFDVVIGNPPYGLKPEPEQIACLSDKYAHWGISSALNDTYLVFFALTLENILKKDGYLSFITPNTWRLTDSAKPFRHTLTSQYQLCHLVQYLNKVFENATVDCDTTIIKKSAPKGAVRIRFWNKSFLNNEHDVPQELLAQQDYINLFLTPSDYDLKAKISAQSVALKDVLTIKNGVKPYEKGKGKPAQTSKTMKEKPFTSEIKKDDSFSPLIGGSSFNRYKLLWDNDYWIQYGEWLAAPREKSIFEAEEKLIVRQTSDSIIGTIIGKGFIMRDNTHIILNGEKSGLHLKYVLALLNSKLVNWYYWTINPEKGEAMAQVKVFHLGLLPVKVIPLSEQQPFIALVDTILSAKKENPAADTTALERQIDEMVYNMYGLTEDETRLNDLQD